jgi:hypothetical protein
MTRARTAISLLAALGILAPSAALARAPVPTGAAPPADAVTAVTPGSLGAQLVEIADAMRGPDGGCTARCYTLEHLTLTGDVKSGKLEFVLEGAVLAKGAPGTVDVSLFGTPQSVRIENVTENGRPALVSFEGDRYFFRPTSERFTLRGTLGVGDDRTIQLPSPLNRFDAKLTGGRVTEGDSLSGLEGGVIHIDSEDSAPAPAPTIFSLARALRVKKNVEFEYRLTLQSGTDLGLVHLPLRYGEKVTDVVGSTGWKVEGEDLVLPTTGSSATVTITGVMTQLGSFTPDSRSPFEWWLLESDQDHRLLTSGDAKQVDSNESPIPRREASGRLFLLTKGQKLDVSLQTLQTMEVLSAVVQRMDRFVVLTSSGDVVNQDTYQYDNSGIDYLSLTPTGKPLFLSIDGSSERLMHKESETALMVPMRVGTHTALTQSLEEYDAGFFFGRRTFTSPTLPLATGHASLRIGLPASMHPVVVTGGDRTQWPVGPSDGIALAIAGLVSFLALRGAKKRALGVAALGGLWFFSHPVFGVTIAATAATGVILGISKLPPRARKWSIGIGVAATLVALPLVFGHRSASSPSQVGFLGGMSRDERTIATDALEADKAAAAAGDFEQQGIIANAPVGGANGHFADDGKLGNFRAQLAQNGMVDGVRPVPLAMPGWDRQVFVQTEMVSAGKPFAPTIWYVTDAGLAVLGLVWLGCAIGLGWSERERMKAARERMKAWLTPKPEDAPAPVEPGEAPAPAE